MTDTPIITNTQGKTITVKELLEMADKSERAVETQKQIIQAVLDTVNAMGNEEKPESSENIDGAANATQSTQEVGSSEAHESPVVAPDASVSAPVQATEPTQ